MQIKKIFKGAAIALSMTALFLSFGIGRAFAAEQSSQKAEIKKLITASFYRCDREIDISSYGLDPEKGSVLAMLTEAYQGSVTGKHFYLNGDFKIKKDERSGLIESLIIGYGTLFSRKDGSSSAFYPPDKTAIIEAGAKFDRALGKAKKRAMSGTGELEKVLILHDYLIRECDYNSSGPGAGGYYPDEDYTAYGVLVKHRAVCNGYAFAFAALASELGIDNRILSSDDMDHAWNLVKISGKWYHLDITRDDRLFDEGTTFHGLKNADNIDEGFADHKYFLRSDGEMRSLGYSGWELQGGGMAPAAVGGRDFHEYLFRKYPRSVFHKAGGRWYTASISGKKLYRSSSLKSSGATRVLAGDGLCYAEGEGNLIYFCKPGGVYTFNCATGAIRKIYECSGKGEKVSELGIKGDMLCYIVLGSGGSSKRVSKKLENVKSSPLKGADGGWTKRGRGRFYYDSSKGKYLKGWQVIGGKAYYFRKSDGRMLTGSHRISGRCYSFSKTGVLVRSHGRALSGRYFFNIRGKPARGLKCVNGRKYYFDKKTCKCVRGWKKIGKKRYYFSKKTGALVKVKK